MTTSQRLISAADVNQARQARYNSRKRVNQIALTLSLAAMAFGLGGELLELIAHALGQGGNAASSGTIVKCAIHPKCAQHLDQVRFSRAVEAADPHGRLLGLLDVLQVDVEHVFQALLVLAIADEGFELVP